MTARTANCPNCGAQIHFLWSGAVQTTCEYCRSILVRHDVDLTKVGTVADLPATSSPVQIGTEGRYRDRTFVVVGRIVYEYERGGWNEWHLVFNDGASGWLADAQAEYAVSFLREGASRRLPDQKSIRRGQQLHLPVAGSGAAATTAEFQVTTLTWARYGGVQGELPFEYWNKHEVLFADLRSADGAGGFATIDYSEPEPLVFVGEFVEFDTLGMTNLKQFEGW